MESTLKPFQTDLEPARPEQARHEPDGDWWDQRHGGCMVAPDGRTRGLATVLVTVADAERHGKSSLSVYLPCADLPHRLPNTFPADDPTQGDWNAAVHDRGSRIDGLRVAGEPSEVNALGAQEALDLLPRWRQHEQASLQLIKDVLSPGAQGPIGNAPCEKTTIISIAGVSSPVLSRTVPIRPRMGQWRSGCMTVVLTCVARVVAPQEAVQQPRQIRNKEALPSKDHCCWRETSRQRCGHRHGIYS
jgi:hypothetical protein